MDKHIGKHGAPIKGAEKWWDRSDFRILESDELEALKAAHDGRVGIKDNGLFNSRLFNLFVIFFTTSNIPRNYFIGHEFKQR